jgi:hypothetical protein
MDETKTPPKTKRPPGRPRINPVRKPPPREGISLEPKSDQNHVEFTYSDPGVFKSLWLHFKHLSVSRLQLVFRPDSMVMWGQGHLQKSQIRVCVDATRINHYYLHNGEEVDVGVDATNMSLLMQKINRSYEEILLLSKLRRTQETLGVTLKTAIRIDEVHNVGLEGEYDRMENEQMFLDEDNYTIQIEFPCAYFKRMVANMVKLTDVVTIRQYAPDKEIVFEYKTANRHITSKNIVRKSTPFNFASRLAEGAAFRASFRVAYVKPIASAVTSGSVILCAHEDKPLLFIIKLDNGTVVVRILTEIIDNRHPGEDNEC